MRAMSALRGRLPALAGEAAVYVGANMLNALLPFLLVPILTRALGPQQYGVVAIFTVTVTVFAAMAGLNSNSAVTVRYFQLDPDHLRAYLGTCLAILAVSTLGILLLLTPLRSLIARHTEVPPTWLFVAVGVAVLNFVTSLRLILWQVARRPWAYSALTVGQSAVYLIVAVVLVDGFGMGWEGATAGLALGALVAGSASAVLLWRSGAIRLMVSVADIRDALAYGVPLIPHMIGGLLIAGADRLLLTGMLGVDQAGIYMVALQIGMGLGLVTGAFNKAYMPWLLGQLERGDPARDVRIVRATYLYGVGLFASASVLSLAAPWLVRLIGGAAFADAARAVPWIAFAYAFGGMYYMVTNYVFHAGKTAYLAWVTLAAGCFGILTTYLRIPAVGMIGAGQGYLLSHMLMFGGTWALAQHVRPMPWLQALRRGAGGSVAET